MAKAKGEKLIADNRRARHDYHLLDRYEAGVVLTGTEVKSLREGKASLQQAYRRRARGRGMARSASTSPSTARGTARTTSPTGRASSCCTGARSTGCTAQVREKGFTVVPTRLYFKDGRVKVEIALARGKELHDKRRDIADRDARREMERQMKSIRR